MLLCAALLCCVPAAWAAPVAGVVVQLSGPLLAKKASGAVKILSLKSEVENGDTLVTEKNTYAMVKFIDNSEVTLRPATTFTIENFSFDAGKPEGDQSQLRLVKGGLRSITGLLGKRSKEKFELKTPTATIGIRGTTFIVEYVPAPAASPGALPVRPGLPPQSVPGNREPGLYFQVLDGMIFVVNPGGTTDFAAGQFGFVPGPTKPAIVLPSNPGMQFAPPASFNSSTGAASNTAAGKANTVDCEVR